MLNTRLGRDKRRNMNKKSIILALAALLLVSVSVGYVVSQILLERAVTGTVTVASQPDLYVLDTQGQALSTIDFGQLSNGVHLTKEIRLWNAGNTPLTINIERTDTSTGILSAVKNQDGSPYEAVTLGMGENLYLKLEIWNQISLSAGVYPLAFKVTGS